MTSEDITLPWTLDDDTIYSRILYRVQADKEIYVSTDGTYVYINTKPLAVGTVLKITSDSIPTDITRSINHILARRPK